MNKQIAIPDQLNQMLNQPCCRQRVGEWKSLHLGFGKKIFHHKKRCIDMFYGEWEVGTYSSNWAVEVNGIILLSSSDQKTNCESDQALQQFNFSHLKKIELIDNDTTIKLSFNEINLLFYVIEDEEEIEVVHFFFPNQYFDYHPNRGWAMEIIHQ